jgi:ABC-type Fe3+ transport system permease subunit
VNMEVRKEKDMMPEDVVICVILMYSIRQLVWFASTPRRRRRQTSVLGNSACPLPEPTARQILCQLFCLLCVFLSAINHEKVFYICFSLSVRVVCFNS